MKNKLLDKKVDGKFISPVLPEDIKNYLIDIDGTICDDIPNEQPERMATAKLYPDALKTLNKWYEQGHYITFFTSRVEEHREVTEKWLNGVSAPRFSATSNLIDVSNRISRQTTRPLEDLGYTVVRNPNTYGFAAVHGIKIQNEEWQGAADPGHDGIVVEV